MAIQTLTWRKSATYTIGSTHGNLRDWIEALKNAIDSEVAAHPATHEVEVSDWDNTEHLEIKWTDAAAVNARALIGFINSPHANALEDGATANSAYGYIFGSRSAGTTGPDQSYTVGNPYATADANALLGRPFCAYNSNIDRLTYYECEEGLLVHFFDLSAFTCHVLWIGFLIKDREDADNAVFAYGVGGITAITTSFWASTNNAGQMVAVESSPAGTDGYLCAANPQDSNLPVSCIRPWGEVVAGNDDSAVDLAGNKRLYTPIEIHAHDAARSRFHYIGPLRQMGYGKAAVRGLEIEEGSVLKAYAVSAGDETTAHDTLYLTQE